MKYIYFGTPDVARETLEHLVMADLRPIAVVTNPDAPKGRGQVMTASPVKEYAESLKIPVLTPEHLNEEFMKELQVFEAELGIVVAYGKILPESLINSFPNGVLNIHYSLLPRWRGASPVESALLHGDKVTGVTIQKMVKKLDAGPILAVSEMEILPEDTTATLRPHLITLGAELLIDTLPKYLAGRIKPYEQNESKVTLAPKFKKEDGELNLEDDAINNWRKYQAYAVWPGTYFFEDGKRMKITQARFEGDRFIVERVIPEGQSERDYLGESIDLK